jgi:hypothetical protein
MAPLLPFKATIDCKKPKTNLQMKKFLYALTILVSLSAFFSACTDENVTPKTSQGGGGGGSTDPMKN